MVYARALRALERKFMRVRVPPSALTFVRLREFSMVQNKEKIVHTSPALGTTECSAAGSALRLGRRGPRSESGHSDHRIFDIIPVTRGIS